MRKITYLVLFVTFFAVFTACGESDPKSRTEATSAPTEEVVKETPTPKSAESDNPYFIGGIDFTAYYNGETIDKSLYTADIDTMRLISFGNKKVDRVLADGDHYVMEQNEENPDGSYFLTLYTPKMVKEFIIFPESKNISYSNEGDYWDGDQAKYREHAGNTFWIKKDSIIKDFGLVISVMYEDNTMEMITVYITKDYVVE